MYGLEPETDVFSVVECEYCGLMLKPQALDNHIMKRHHIDSISENPQLPPEPPTKKMKLADCDEFECKSVQLIQSCTDADDYFKKPFTPPPKKEAIRRNTCDEETQQSVSGKVMLHLRQSLSLDNISHQQSETKLLVKLKRCGEDSWAIVSP